MSGTLSRAVMRPGIVRLVLVVVPIQIPKLALMAVWTWMLVLALILRVRPVVTPMSLGILRSRAHPVVSITYI